MDCKTDQLRLLILRSLHPNERLFPKSSTFSSEDWKRLYIESGRQAIWGVTWLGIKTLPPGHRPPEDIESAWMDKYEKIRSANAKIGKAISLVTAVTDSHGKRSAVLKGQTKAHYYPLPEARTPGDIDLWVEDGREFADLLAREFGAEGKSTYHHFHTTCDFLQIRGVPLEIHWRPSSGCFNPIANRKIQRFLDIQVEDTERVDSSDGGYFYKPSSLFNMVSELVHIRRHFVGSGIGMRHIIDMYYLVQQCPPSQHEALLKELGLYRFTGAVAYVLCQYLNLDGKTYFGMEPDRNAGRILLSEILEGGNFGQFAPRQRHGAVVRLLMRERRNVRLFSVCPSEFLWHELHYWWIIAKTLPQRIIKRKLSLRDE